MQPIGIMQKGSPPLIQQVNFTGRIRFDEQSFCDRLTCPLIETFMELYGYSVQNLGFAKKYVDILRAQICGWIWMVRLSKTAGISGYFEDFVIQEQLKTNQRYDVRMLTYFFASLKYWGRSDNSMEYYLIQKSASSQNTIMDCLIFINICSEIAQLRLLVIYSNGLILFYLFF